LPLPFLTGHFGEFYKMPRIAYVNGQYLPISHASVNIEDRGYQFSDGVYEVCLVVNGAFWDFDAHLARLDRSLGALEIKSPIKHAALEIVMKTLLCKNRLRNALIYLQVTRGVAPRNHSFPSNDIEPSLVITARPFDLTAEDVKAEKGIAVITVEDERWARGDSKSISLLATVLAKQAAVKAGAKEAWLIRDGKVTEGSSSNAWIITKEGALITRPVSHEILSGITRQTLFECARDLQMPVIEQAFSLDDAKAADEAFITSATNLVMPVIAIDGHAIGNGSPGPQTMRLREAYKLRAEAFSKHKSH